MRVILSGSKRIRALVAFVLVLLGVGAGFLLVPWRDQASAQSTNPMTYIPENRVGVAPIVSISDALSYYASVVPSGGDSSETAPGTCAGDADARHPQVRDLARSLPASSDEIFKYVRDNIEFEATFGLKKGAPGAVLDGDGNAFDQSQLLVELLRANGFCARYVFGTAEASLSQLQNWLGVTDLDAAERYFADGGIPVERSGANLRFAHVWVQLYGASGSTAYDPSFKTRLAAPSAVDLAEIVGITSSDLRTRLEGTGTTSRTYDSTTTFDNNLRDRAQALSSLLYANTAPAGMPSQYANIDFTSRSLNDLFGIGEIEPLAGATLSTVTRMPLTSYPSQHLTWYSVPERFRTMVAIRVGLMTSATEATWHIDTVLPLDVAANSLLWVNTTFAGHTSPSSMSTGKLQLMLDGHVVGETPALSSDEESEVWFVSIDVAQPYAANSGSYLDTRSLERIDARSTSVLIASSGQSSSSRRNTELSRAPFADVTLQRNIWISGNSAVSAQLCMVPTSGIGGSVWTIPTRTLVPSMAPGCPSQPSWNPDSMIMEPDPPNPSCTIEVVTTVWEPNIVSVATSDLQPCTLAQIGSDASAEGTPEAQFSGQLITKIRAANAWVYQASRARQVTAGLAQGVSQNHIVVGVVTSSLQVEPYHNSVTGDQLRIHAESSLSFNRRSGAANANARAAMAGAFNAAANALEGFALQNALGAPIAGSVGSRFRWSIAFDTANTDINFRNIGTGTGPDGAFRMLTLSEWQTQGAAMWTGTTQYGSMARSLIQTKLEEGYVVFLPSWGTLGPEVATEQRRQRPTGLSELEWYNNVYRNGSAAIVLYNPTSGAVSHLLFDPVLGVFKGGGVTPELSAAEIRRPTSEDLDNAQDPWSELVGVDDRDGRLTLSPPADITFGGSPLAYQRTYNSELAATRHFSSGWRDNHFNEFNLSGGAAAQFGEERPAHAAAMLVAIMSALKLHEAALDIDTVVGSQLAATWWTDGMLMSVATAEHGVSQTSYYRSPNGTWLGETPRAGTLTQTGQITVARRARIFDDPLITSIAGPQPSNAVRISYGFDTSATSFVERSPEGEIRRWSFHGSMDPSPTAAESWEINAFIPSQGSGGPVYCDMTIGNAGCDPIPYTWHVLTQVQSNCPEAAIGNAALCHGVDLNYSTSAGATIVADNLGNSLTINGSTISSNNGVELQRTWQAPPVGNQGGSRLTSVRYRVGGTTIWEQKYEYENAHGASSTISYQPLLTDIYLPQDHVIPYMQVAYTADDRVDSVTRANNQVWNHLATGQRSEVRDPTGAAQINWYDRNGRLVETRDRAGRVSRVTNDGAGRRIAVRSRDSATAVGSFDEGFDYSYDRFDNMVLQRQLARSGQSGAPIDTSWEYALTDFPTLPTKVIAPLNRQTVTTYDSHGLATRVDGPQNERSDYIYDTRGFPTESRVWISTASNDYRSTQFDYTYNGEAHRGLIRRVVETPNPSEGGGARISTFQWDVRGDLIGVINPRTYYAGAGYDAARRMTRFDRRRGSTSGASLGARTEFDYDLNGRLLHLREAKTIAATSWADTEARYTLTGRLERVIDPGGDTDLFTYDDRDWLSTVTDGAGRVTDYAYDAAGRLTCERRGVGSGVAQAYQSVGYLYWDAPQRLRPARGSNADCSQSSTTYDTTYAFDAYGRVRTSTFPDATTTIEDRNAAGEVTTLTNRSGQVTTSTYDNSGRVLTRTTPEGVYTFQYNRAGEMTRAGFTPSGGSERWTALDLDGFGRLVAEQRWDGLNTGFEYDANDNRTAIIWPDNWRAEYVYDELDRLTEVKGGASGSVVTLARYQYDDRGRRTQTAYGPTAGSPVSSLTYTWQDDNDLQQIVHAFSGTNVTIGHGYDASGRVTSTTPSDADWMWSPASASTESYSAANALNQYSNAAGETLAWDTRGNLATYGAMTLTHNSANQLTGASRSSGGTFSATYTYDALGRRVARAGTNVTAARFIHAGSEEIADVDPSTSTILRRFVPGLGTDQPVAYIEHVGGTQTYYYHQDRLGNVVAIANASGALADRYVYTPYGIEEPLVTTGQPFRYTARRFDAESNLYYYRARYYSARIGRFLQTDPIGYADDLNLYAYVSADPLKHTDPTGTQQRPTPREQLNQAARLAAERAMERRVLRAQAGQYRPQNLPTGPTFFTAPGSTVHPAMRAQALAEQAARTAEANGQCPPLLTGPRAGAQQPWTGVPLSTTRSEPTTAYRVYGGVTERLGGWLTLTRPESRSDAMSRLALPPENTAESVAPVTIPPGARFMIGEAAPAFGRSGGGQQIWMVDRLPASAFGAGQPLPE